jgi:hypothetical protein
MFCVRLLDDFNLEKPMVVSAGRNAMELGPGTWCAVADGIFISRGNRTPREVVTHPSREAFYPRYAHKGGW